MSGLFLRDGIASDLKGVYGIDPATGIARDMKTGCMLQNGILTDVWSSEMEPYEGYFDKDNTSYGRADIKMPVEYYNKAIASGYNYFKVTFTYSDDILLSTSSYYRGMGVFNVYGVLPRWSSDLQTKSMVTTSVATVGCKDNYMSSWPEDTQLASYIRGKTLPAVYAYLPGFDLNSYFIRASSIGGNNGIQQGRVTYKLTPIKVDVEPLPFIAWGEYDNKYRIFPWYNIEEQNRLGLNLNVQAAIWDSASSTYKINDKYGCIRPSSQAIVSDALSSIDAQLPLSQPKEVTFRHIPQDIATKLYYSNLRVISTIDTEAYENPSYGRTDYNRAQIEWLGCIGSLYRNDYYASNPYPTDSELSRRDQAVDYSVRIPQFGVNSIFGKPNGDGWKCVARRKYDDQAGSIHIGHGENIYVALSNYIVYSDITAFETIKED